MATYQSLDLEKKLNARPHLDRAQESLRAADLLQAEGLHADAVTRAHQATIHAERGLLAMEDRNPPSVRNVHRMATLHFLQNGVIAGDHAERLEALAALRARADDLALVTITEADGIDALTEARVFLADVEAFLTEGGIA